MAGKQWSEFENTVLLDFYENSRREILQQLLPGRTWQAICVHAVSLGLDRTKIGHHKTDIDKLVGGTLESYYWLGFLVADGHFSKKGSISLHLDRLDSEHIEKYAKYINANIRTHKNRVIVDVQQPEVCQKICAMFGTDNRKSYHCPILPEMSDEQFIAFFAGLFDGDGNVDTSHACSIRIKCHISWADFYQQIVDRIAKLSNTSIPSVRKNKFMVLNICNSSVLSYLKNKAVELNIPILLRKWDKIDETKISIYDSAKITNNNILKLKSEGKKIKEIAKLLNITVSGVYSSLSRTAKYEA